MKIEIPRFTVAYKGAEFVFKYGTERDVIQIIDSQSKPTELRKYFQSRLIEIKNLEIDGKEATPLDIMDLPSNVINEIVSQWITATIDFRKSLVGGSDSKKKKSTKK